MENKKSGTFISEIIFQLFRSSDTDRRSADLIFGFLQQNRMLETNQDYAGKLCGEAVLEVSRVSSDADYLHRAIYQNSSELEDLLNYFRYDTEEYLKRHLDTYASSNTLDNKDIYSYVENAYSAYPDIKEIEFISYTNNKTTVFYSENDIRVNHEAGNGERRFWTAGLPCPVPTPFRKKSGTSQHEDGGVYCLYI